MECKKKKFDKLSAQIALMKAKSRNTWKRMEIRIYYCDICHAWHLTSNPKEAQ